MVTWEEVRRLDQNSIITDYEILLEALDFPAEIPTDTITTTNLSIMIIDLEEFINYNISVRAMTNVGPGPYSDPVTVRTFEDGNIPPKFVSPIRLISFCCSIFRTSSTSSECPSHSYLLH